MLYGKNFTQITPDLSFAKIANRLIAVDTEYQSLKSYNEKGYPDPNLLPIQRQSGIRYVWCISFNHYDIAAKENRAKSYWLAERGEDGTVTQKMVPDILEEVAKLYGIEDPIFVSHYLDAEYEALTRVGVDPFKYTWVDTWVAYKLRANAFNSTNTFSLASMVKHLMNTDIDTDHKEKMRELCISGDVWSDKDQIMAYCESDTLYLVPCLLRAEKDMNERYPHDQLFRFSVPKERSAWQFISIVSDHMDALVAFIRIAHRGLPVNPDRVRALREGARVETDNLIRSFVEKYPGSFTREPICPTATLDKVWSRDDRVAYLKENSKSNALAKLSQLIQQPNSKGKVMGERSQNTCMSQMHAFLESYTERASLDRWKKKESVLQEYLSVQLSEQGTTDYPKTASGKLALDKDTLGDFFGGDDSSFGGEYMQLMSKVQCLNGIRGEGTGNWLDNFDPEDGLMRYQSLYPFTTVTGRCAPKPSKGWVFGWDKSLYVCLEPKPGKWMVELDYGSEETFIQACMFNDNAYDTLYRSKDIYLKVGEMTGIIPTSDFEQMSLSDLKHKYKKQRDFLKIFTLAISYGAGNKKLAIKTGMDIEEVMDFRNRYNSTFAKSYSFRERLKRMIENKQKVGMTLYSGWDVIVNSQEDKSLNAPLNFPIQATGSYILHCLVRVLDRMKVDVLATIHDAILFQVDEGDTATINKVRQTMAQVATLCLGREGMRVGEPEIIEHGKVWTPEHSKDEEGLRLLRAGGMKI